MFHHEDGGSAVVFEVDPTKVLVARFEFVDADADGLDDSGDVGAVNRPLRSEQSFAEPDDGRIGRSRCQSSACNEVARTATSTALSPMVGVGT